VLVGVGLGNGREEASREESAARVQEAMQAHDKRETVLMQQRGKAAPHRSQHRPEVDQVGG